MQIFIYSSPTSFLLFTENLCDEDELGESSDEERSGSEEECTPKIGATLRGRESSSTISRKRKHDIGM